MLPARTPRRIGVATVVALTALSLTACAGSPEPETAPTNAPAASNEMRTVTDVGGEVEIPVDPERVVALDEAAALNLMSIGITPDVVFDSWKTAIPLQIIKDAGIEIVSTAAIFPELEEVAETDPDLIVGSINEAYVSRYPDYASIAPLLRATIQAETDQEDIPTAYGRYFDRPEEAARVVSALESRAAEIAESQQGNPRLTALMAYPGSSMVMHIDGDSSMAPAIAASGFTQPDLQAAAPEGGSLYGGWTEFSPETLPEHDGDILVVTSAANYPSEGITSLPLYSSMEAVKNGSAFIVDGDMWAGAAGFPQYWVLEDLALLAEGSVNADAAVSSAEDAQARWDAFTAAIGQ